MFVLGLRHLGTARTGAYFSTAPFLGAILAVAVFGEPISLGLITAGLLMGFGVYLHLAENHDHRHSHEALDHDIPMTSITVINTPPRGIPTANRTRIGINMRPWPTGIRISRTCIIGTFTKRKK
jgi:hypothetical protein